MTTPIRPSLAQLLSTSPQVQAQSLRPATPPPPATPTTAAQKSLFSQIMGQSQSIAPATYRAEDIQRATAPLATKTDPEQKILRPGSYINIRV